MVAEQIRRELSDMLCRDKVLQHAVLPEAALGADMYLTSLATISDVEVSRDLQVAKVYVSIYGDDRGQEIAMEGLKAKNKYVRSQLGKRMKLRLTPEVRFIKDDSLERGSRVNAILEELKQERKMKEKKNRSANSDLEEDIHPRQMRSNPKEEEMQTESSDEEWESDEDDGDLIYIR
ncbi:hypothetical protein SUGI_0462490 [Cryptomeria japonica]|nr:hypothetical protein SUGI_0462490 [Cryptomeria japonica]